MYKVISFCVLLLFVTSCGVKIGEDGIDVNDGKGAKIEIGEEGVVLDDNNGNSINIGENGVDIKLGEGGNLKISDDGVVIDGVDVNKDFSDKRELENETADGYYFFDNENNKSIELKGKEGSLEMSLDSDEFRFRKIEGGLFFTINEEGIYIRNSESSNLFAIEEDEIYFRKMDGGIVVDMDDNGITIRDKEGNMLIDIDDKEIDNYGDLSEVLSFGENFEVYNSAKINTLLNIGDLVEFKDDIIVLGQFEINKNGLYREGVKVKDLKYLDFGNDKFLSNTKISFAENIYITKDEIRYKDSIINKNQIKLRDNIYINNEKVFYKGKSN